MEKKCVCGMVFKTDNKNAKYCSQKCFHKYKDKKLKPRKIQVQRVCECGTSFWIDKAYLDRMAGKNVGIFCSFKCKCIYCNKGHFKNGHTPYAIKKEYSETPTYQELHNWIRRRLIKEKKCSFCGKEGCRTEWANKSQEYNKDLGDWIELCVKCHRNYDKGNTLKSAIKKFGAYKNKNNDRNSAMV